MPFRSEKQRRFMHANHPKIAERWEHERDDPGRERAAIQKAWERAKADGRKTRISPGEAMRQRTGAGSARTDRSLPKRERR